MNTSPLLSKRFILLLILASTIFFALFIADTSGQSGTCVEYGPIDGAGYGWLLFPSSNILRGRAGFYDFGCQQAFSSVRVPGSAWILADSARTAWAICELRLGGNIQIGRDSGSVTPGVWICNSDAVWKPTPYIPTGDTLSKQTDLTLSAVDGFYSGIQFQRLDAGGVGLPEVVAMEVLDAVDVWGEIGGGYEVCFPHAGNTIFLDAANAPRTIEPIAHRYEHGYTCVAHDRAGTIVVVRADTVRESESAPAPAPVAVAVAPPVSVPSFAPDGSPTVTLADCQISAIENMHFRLSPAGGSRGLMPAGMTLDATARKRDWFFVTYNEREGWLSAEHVEPAGDCAYPDDPAASARTVTILPTFSDDTTAVLPLENCVITAIDNMHFRASPAGVSRGLIPAGTMLASPARLLNWFFATWSGRKGWLSARYVETTGDCDYSAAADPAVRAATANPVFAPDDSAEVTLDNCLVTAIENMHLRIAPGQAVRALVPAGYSLDATARKRYWYFATYIGHAGWLSAAHLVAEGDCAYPDDDA